MSPDLNGELTAVKFLHAQVLVAAGTATVAGVDLQDFIGNLKLILTTASTHATGGTGAQISLLDSADNTTFVALTAPTFALATAATGQVSVGLDTRSVRRYVQAKYIVTGTTATFDLSLVGVGLKRVI